RFVILRRARHSGSVELNWHVAGNVACSSLDGMRPVPKVGGNHEGIDTLALPPAALIATPVQLAMVQPADRHGEAVADLASHRARLHKLEVMGIRRGPPADEARLRRHEPQMVAVALRYRPFDGDSCRGGGVTLQ